MPTTNTNDPQAQKIALIEALNEHRINTLRELRRIERIFADLGSSDLTQPMTAACTIEHPFNPMSQLLTMLIGVYFVNSNSLLTELRALTKNYPIRYTCPSLPLFPRSLLLPSNPFTHTPS